MRNYSIFYSKEKLIPETIFDRFIEADDENDGCITIDHGLTLKLTNCTLSQKVSK